jgi:hypothetical protein
MNPLELNPTEERALSMLLAGDDPVLGALRRQVKEVFVAKRETSTAGFFTEFYLTAGQLLLKSGKKDFQISDVNAESNGLVCGFILSVRAGALWSLECHLRGDGKLPSDPTFVRWYYIQQAKPDSPQLSESSVRDLGTERKKWADNTNPSR